MCREPPISLGNYGSERGGNLQAPMLTFLDDTAADELDGQLEGSMMACVWLHGGDYYVLTNTDRSVAAHILAGAVLEAITQGNETAQ